MFVVGLDLGQAKDYTAISIVERTQVAPSEQRQYTGFEKGGIRYDLRHLERVKLGTPYPDVVAHVATLLHQPALSGKTSLAVDATGVGPPVVDLLRMARLPSTVYAITITGGDVVIRLPDGYRVPKRDLISTLQVMLHTGRLKVAESLPEAQTLVKELLAYKVKITDSGRDVYGAWREGQHDDLILATAMAVWLGEQTPAVMLPLSVRARWVS